MALLLVGVVHVAATIYAGEKLGAKLRAVEARQGSAGGGGFGVSGVSDADNAAPLYVAAAAWERLHDRPGGWDPTVPAGTASTLRVGYQDLWFSDGRLRPLSADEFGDLQRLVALDRPALDLIREGARRTHCQFAADGDPFERRSPRPGVLHQVGKLLLANALVAARTGRDETALECLRLVFTVARHGGEDPSLGAALDAACGASSRALTLAAHVLPSLRLEPRATRSLAEELARGDLGKTLPERWAFQQQVGRHIFGTVDTPEGARNLTLTSLAPVPQFLESLFWRHHGRGLLGPWLDLDQVRYLEEMGKWEAVLGASPRARAQAWQGRSGPFELSGPWWAPVTRHACSPPVDWARTLDCADVSRDLLRVVLGLELYRHQRGTYPESLQALRAVGWKAPKDRFSEAELVYRRQGTRFVLYSVGPNLQDDGGRPGLWPLYRRFKAPPGPLEGDIVWECAGN